MGNPQEAQVLSLSAKAGCSRTDYLLQSLLQLSDAGRDVTNELKKDLASRPKVAVVTTRRSGL